MFERFKKSIRQARLLQIHQHSAGAIERWQSARLREIVRHAMQNVPTYQHEYANKGIDVAAVHGTGDLHRIPILTRDFFLEKAIDEHVDNSRRIANPIWKKTFGTKGKPLTMLASDAYLDPAYANLARFRFLWSTGSPLISAINMRVAHISRRTWRRRGNLFVSIADFLSYPKAMAERIAQFEPDVVIGPAHLLLSLAQKISRNECPSIRPRYAVTLHDVLTPSARSIVQEAFQCDVFDRYDVGEAGVVGTECAHHDGFHIHSESIFLEIVDEHGTALAAGRNGRVIITDLLNYNMPLIRYDTDDYGYIIPESCACGSSTPRLRLTGRA